MVGSQKLVRQALTNQIVAKLPPQDANSYQTASCFDALLCILHLDHSKHLQNDGKPKYFPVMPDLTQAMDIST